MTKMSLLNDLSLVIADATAPAASAGQAGAQSGSSALPMLGQLAFFGFIFAAMYFLMIAPQRKKQKEHDAMLKALKSGDEIVTTGGIYGTITNVKDDRFVVRVSDTTKVEVGKGFVSTVVKRADGDGTK